MAIQINIPLTTTAGLDIPLGSVVVYDTNFSAGTNRMINNFHLYKSVEDYQNGKAPIKDNVDLLGRSNIQEFSKADFLDLNLIKVEIAVQNCIESRLGIGNTSIIDLMPD